MDVDLHEAMGPLKLHVTTENWPLKAPFRISGYTWESIDVLLVTLEKDGFIGFGEAAGVYYKKETPASMVEKIEVLRATIEAGISHAALLKLLPPAGARNAVDCALWDLKAKLTGRAVWQMAQLERPRPLLTTFTCGAETPAVMAATALGYENARAIKLKLTGDASDADRVRAVRDALPNVWLAVDANQGLTRSGLEKIMPVLVEMRVSLIEQPFPVGQEAKLDGFQSPIPIAADESVQNISDIQSMAGRFSAINIKLDKCGGFTEGLAMARAAHGQGLGIMVGNMIGTSLAMAPAYLVGQLCEVVDLDGPVFLRDDRAVRVEYDQGTIRCSRSIWG